MRFIWQSLLLALSFGFVFFWQHTPLSRYTIQSLGFLILLFLLISTRKKGLRKISLDGDTLWTVFTLNTLVLLIVFSTGGFSSPVFFLLYFLGFGVAFAFSPATVIVFVAGMLLNFLPLALKEDATRNLVMLGSLVLISPLAFFFGRKYQKGTFCFMLIVLYLLMSGAPANAITTSNDSYILQSSNINPGNSPTEEKTQQTKSSEQTFPPPLIFSISETMIDFGKLSPTDPVTRTNILSVSQSGFGGYSIIGFEYHPLTSSSSSIPNTACDDGQCSPNESSPWENVLTYGFGYRCDNLEGNGCVGDFTNSSFYKRFSNMAIEETPQILMRGEAYKKEGKIQITYKVNVPPTQAEGVYTNIINYIASPNF